MKLFDSDLDKYCEIAMENFEFDEVKATRDEINYEAYELMTQDEYESLHIINEAIDNHPNDWKTEGVVGRWDGKHPVSTLLSRFKNFNDFREQALDDCYYIYLGLNDKKGCIEMSGTHHDGEVDYELYPMSKKGGIVKGYIKQFMKQNFLEGDINNE